MGVIKTSIVRTNHANQAKTRLTQTLGRVVTALKARTLENKMMKMMGKQV
jgi:hypothetical protein